MKLKTTKEQRDGYRTLVDVHISPVINLLDDIDTLEAEHNAMRKIVEKFVALGEAESRGEGTSYELWFELEDEARGAIGKPPKFE
jgi:hypothetical protein